MHAQGVPAHQPLHALCRLLRFDVLHRLVEFAPELLDAVPDTVQVGTKANDLPGCRRGFLDVLVTHAAEPQLLSMEGCSIRTVDGGRRPEGYEGLVAGVERRVAEHPGDHAPLVLKLRIGHPAEPLGHGAQCLLDLVENFLARHRPSSLLHDSTAEAAADRDGQQYLLVINDRQGARRRRRASHAALALTEEA